MREIIEVLEKRKSLYEKSAEFTVYTSNKSINKIVDEILRITNFSSPLNA
jgi:shikimate kinase